MKYCKVSRRMFLQGVGGYSLAIPFLESLVPSIALAQSATAPKRYVSIVSNYDYGHGRAWYPTLGTLPQALNAPGHAPMAYQSLRTLLGGNARLSTALGPGLNPHLGSLNLFRGLDIVEYFGHGFGHTIGNLAGSVNNPNLGNLPALQTIDQVLGRNARFNPKASEPFLLSNLNSSAHPTNTVSWGPDGSSRIVRKGTRAYNAQTMFETLFRGGAVPESGQSTTTHPRRDVLSRVMEDYARIKNRRQISSQDRVVLDNALDKIAEVQRNVAAETKMTNGCSYKGLSRAADGDLFRSSVTLKNMADMIVAAMQCDLNRVFSFSAFINDAVYDKTGSEFHGGHSHPATESVNGKPNWQYMAEIQGELITYFLVPLLNGMSAAIDAENGKSILYNSLVQFGIEHGTVHGLSDMPTLLAGNAGGALTSGHMIDYSNRELLSQNPYNLSTEGGWNATPGSPLFCGYYFGIPYNRVFVTILRALGLQASEYERSDINGFFRNRTDGAVGGQNNGIANVGGYGYIGVANPLTQSDQQGYNKKYNKYNFHYFKDPLPMPATSSS